MILNKTTSSPELSLASNLHREAVLLSSERACPRPIELGLIRSHRKKLCRDDRAADVIGPVDSGDRIIAKKGARSVVSGKDRMSITSREFLSNLQTCTNVAYHQPPLRVFSTLGSHP